jgi:UDP-2,3-diacylglucosamine pyrophosphatase LpxH
MQSAPLFDELSIISDLHLGGAEGFQIFDRGALAAAFIDGLTARPSKRRVGLVINGDLVDFLAEPNATWFDPEGATGKLERIVADPAFSPVFEALRRFTAKAGRQLAITLGNHDLELALPWVRQRFLELLGNDEAARGRITLAFDGAGYRCQVGTATVLCVHGNEVDEWNVTDHDQIRQIGRDLTQGRGAEAWKPNAGTRMVIEVMNEIKKRHPFVDLLKPEFGAAVPALLHLEPSLGWKIADIAKVAVRMKWDALKMSMGFLSADPALAGGRRQTREPSSEEVLLRFLGGRGGAGTAGEGRTVGELLARAEVQFEEGRKPLDLVQPGASEEKLGWTKALWQKLTGKSDAEVLRAAIDGVQKDRSFELTDPDDTFHRLDERMGPGMDYVISGHTHLRRALRRTRGPGFYFNTGTWVRLIQLKKDQLKDEKAFGSIFETLKAPTLKLLDQSGQILRMPTAACLTATATGVRAALYEIKPGPGNTAISEVVPDSEFPRP